LKNTMMIARTPIGSNGCSHRCFTGISAQAELKPSFSKEGLHD
jgi:hypothetical protein